MNTPHSNPRPEPADQGSGNPFRMEAGPVEVQFLYLRSAERGAMDWHGLLRDAGGHVLPASLRTWPGGEDPGEPALNTAVVEVDEAMMSDAELAVVPQRTLLRAQVRTSRLETGPRACMLLEALADKLVFPADLQLFLGLLDLEADRVELALAKGADVHQLVQFSGLPLDYLEASLLLHTENARRVVSGMQDPLPKSPAVNPRAVAEALAIRRALQRAGARSIQPLIAALRSGEFGAARACLLNGLPLDARTAGGVTPLVDAILRRDLAAVRWLLDNGAGRQEAAHSMFPGHLDLWDPLKGTCAANHATPFDLTPLHAACLADFPEAFEALLDPGTGQEHFAALVEDILPPPWALPLMARHGGDLAAIPGWTRWLLLCPDTPEAVDSLLQVAHVLGAPTLDQWASRGISVLSDLTRLPETPQRLRLLRGLLELGVFPDLPASATKKRKPRGLGREVLRHLPPDETSPPLHHAVANNRKAMEALLRQFGADPKARDGYGRTLAEMHCRTGPSADGHALERWVRGDEGTAMTNPVKWALDQGLLPEPEARTVGTRDILVGWLAEGGDPSELGLLSRAAAQGDIEAVEVLLSVAHPLDAVERALRAVEEAADAAALERKQDRKEGAPALTRAELAEMDRQLKSALHKLLAAARNRPPVE